MSVTVLHQYAECHLTVLLLYVSLWSWPIFWVSLCCISMLSVIWLCHYAILCCVYSFCYFDMSCLLTSKSACLLLVNMIKNIWNHDHSNSTIVCVSVYVSLVKNHEQSLRIIRIYTSFQLLVDVFYTQRHLFNHVIIYNWRLLFHRQWHQSKLLLSRRNCRTKHAPNNPQWFC